MLIIGGSVSGKTNALLNFIEMIYLYAKDVNEPKYQFLIKKRENVGIKHLSDTKAFIECSRYMNEVYNNINGYKSKRKRKIVFDYMIVNISKPN